MFGFRVLTSLLLTLICLPCFGQYQAVWGGRTYNLGPSGRICSNPGCRMCNSLQAQVLAARSSYPTATPRQVLGIAERKVEQKFDPTPHLAVTAMLGVLQPEEGKVLYDLGCGDARIMIAANKLYSCCSLGIELNETTYKKGHQNLLASNARGWRIIRGDATVYSLSQADYITVYLYPSVLENIAWSTLKPGAKVISYNHPLPLPSQKIETEIEGNKYTFYLHEKQ